MKRIYVFPAILIVFLSWGCGSDSPGGAAAGVDSAKVMPITTKSPEARQLFEQARDAVQNGNYRVNAEDLLKQAIGLDTTFALAYAYYAMYWPEDSIARPNVEKAKKFASRVSKEEQLFIEAAEYRLDLPNDPDESLLTKLVTTMCPGDKYLWQSLNYLLFNKDPEIAATFGEKALQIDPDFPGAYFNLGYTYMVMQEFNKAKEVFDRFIERFPRDGKAFSAMGDVYLQVGDLERALSYKERAYELDSFLYWLPDEIEQIRFNMETPDSPPVNNQ